MLIAGRYFDRHGSRYLSLAALGMPAVAGGLALTNTLQVHSSFAMSATALAIAGGRLGRVLEPNTAAMIGTVPGHDRGVAAGARMVLNKGGSVPSIAFVLAIVTVAIPQQTLFAIFSGLARGLGVNKLAPFIIHNMHVALRAIVVASIAGALVSLMRPGPNPV